MYPYFYPCYFAQPMVNPAGTWGPPAPGTASAPAPQFPASTGIAPAPAPQFPSMPGTAPAPPISGELPPVTGTTAGLPVESVPPAPPYQTESPAPIGQQPGLPVIANTEFTQGFLRTQIGKRVRIEFLIGTNSTTDRIGELVDVGISYVLLRLAETDDLLMADLYAIKFVTIYL